MMVLLYCRLQVFNDDRIARADVEGVRLGALAKEERKCLLSADLNVRLHLDAFASPEVIQVALAEPLFGPLSVELMLGYELHALIVFDVDRKLIVAGHRMPKQAILVACLLRLVVHELVAELCISARAAVVRVMIEVVIHLLRERFSLFCFLDLLFDMVALIMSLPVLEQRRFVFLVLRLWIVLFMLVLFMLLVISSLVLKLFTLSTDFSHSHARLMPKRIMDRSMWLGQQVSIAQVPLNRLNVVAATTFEIFVPIMLLLLVLAHVLLDCFDCSRGLRIVIILVMLLHLGVLHTLDETLHAAFLLQDVKPHLEDVMHLELVAEALFLEVRVNVAKSLAARRVLHAH